MSLPEKVRHFLVIGFVILVLAGGVTFVVIMKENSDKLNEESTNITVAITTSTKSTSLIFEEAQIQSTQTDSSKSLLSTEVTKLASTSHSSVTKIDFTTSTSTLTSNSTSTSTSTESTSVLSNSEYSLKDSEKQFEISSGLIRVPMIRKLF